MKVEQEVRHKSEDIEDDVLLDAVKAIHRRVRVLTATTMSRILLDTVLTDTRSLLTATSHVACAG
jgi:hypothetical protein